jgi:ribose transport system permease protein
MEDIVLQKSNTQKPIHLVTNVFKRSDVSVVIATLILTALFSFTNESFLTGYNLFNISRTASLYMFVALSQAMVLIVGGMNLSLGAIGGLSVVAAGICLDKLGLPGWVAIVAALLVGVATGFTNGVLITKMKLNAFVVTLATSFVFTGLVFGISKGFPYTNIPKDFTTLGRGGFGDFPYLLVLILIVLLIIGYVFKFNVIGRRLLATGGNLEAAELSGIKTDNMIILANVLSGMFASAAGLLWISRMGSAQPATGADWMIISFAVAVIGGTALQGGAISSLGILAAGYMIALVKNGLVMLGVNVYFEQTFLGLIILAAVSVEVVKELYVKRRR